MKWSQHQNSLKSFRKLIKLLGYCDMAHKRCYRRVTIWRVGRGRWFIIQVTEARNWIMKEVEKECILESLRQKQAQPHSFLFQKWMRLGLSAWKTGSDTSRAERQHPTCSDHDWDKLRAQQRCSPPQKWGESQPFWEWLSGNHSRLIVFSWPNVLFSFEWFHSIDSGSISFRYVWRDFILPPACRATAGEWVFLSRYQFITT